MIIVDGKGDLGSALFGDLMVTQAQAAGIAGLVVDGAVRDINELIERGYPIFAAGRNPAGPTKGIAGRLSIPICVAGAPVNPGDLVVGDADGVVVIPRNDVDAVLVAAAKKLAEEQQRLKEIAEGSLVSPGSMMRCATPASSRRASLFCDNPVEASCASIAAGAGRKAMVMGYILSIIGHHGLRARIMGSLR